MYRSANFYCIAVDAKADKTITNMIRRLTQCYANIVMPTELFKVYWGDISVLRASVDCFKSRKNYKNNKNVPKNNLVLRKHPWNYGIIFLGSVDCEKLHELFFYSNYQLLSGIFFIISNPTSRCSLIAKQSKH